MSDTHPYKFVLGLNETEGTLFLDLQPKGERPLHSEESSNISRTIVTNIRVLISIPVAKPVKRKSTNSPVNEKVSGLQHRLHLLPLRRIIVRSGFRKGITLLRSRSLRNNSRNFENKWIHRIQLSLFPFYIQLTKPFIRLIILYSQKSIFPLTRKSFSFQSTNIDLHKIFFNKIHSYFSYLLIHLYTTWN